MIKLFHLINGEQLIGRCWGPQQNMFSISRPMYVERTQDGGMRLRDTLTLSDGEEAISIMDNNILFTTTPLTEMIEYYEMASVYSNSITKLLVRAQILESAVDMKRMLEEDAKEMSTTIKNSGGIVH